MKEFIFPEMERGDQVCCVYKMSFDCGGYYIGSALNLRQRLNSWKFKLNSGIDKNYRVTEAFKNTSKVVFEIVDIVDDPVMRRFREDGYIKIHFGKPLCLNIAPSAFTNAGIKYNPNRKVSNYHYKPVVKINDSGEIIEQYSSVKEANIKNNTTNVSDCFKNCFRKVKGMMFRELDKDGAIIPAPIMPLKERKPRKKGYKLSEETKLRIREKNRIFRKSKDYVPPITAKPISQFTIDGSLVNTYSSIMEAARTIGSNTDTFRKAIKKSPNNFTKGFIWKYA